MRNFNGLIDELKNMAVKVDVSTIKLPLKHTKKKIKKQEVISIKFEPFFTSLALEKHSGFGGNRIAGAFVHKIFDMVSKGIIDIKEINSVINGIPYSIKKDVKKLINTALNSEIKNIILPAENSFSELEFIAEIHGKRYHGFMDRVIIDDRVKIYEYKTQPDIIGVKKHYLPQLELYIQAAKMLFKKEVEAYFVFVAKGVIEKVE